MGGQCRKYFEINGEKITEWGGNVGNTTINVENTR